MAPFKASISGSSVHVFLNLFVRSGFKEKLEAIIILKGLIDKCNEMN